MANETFFLRMRELLGESFDDFAQAMSAPPSKAICVNTKKISEDALISALPYLCRKIPYSDGGYYIDAGDEKIGSHPLFFSGAFYSQEPSAQGPVSSVTIRPDFKILDVCAAPGGKSSQAANKLSGGVLVSNEINQSRAAVLMSNIERQGFSNVIITNTDAKTLAAWYDGVFDLVICDAPCSGEGMFRKDDDAFRMWSPELVDMCAARQRDIIKNAALCVRRGGYLVYSTCTYSKEENEDVVKSFLDENPDFELVPPTPEIIKMTCDGIDMPMARRFYPHISGGEGQFLATMKRAGDERGEVRYADGAQKLGKDEEMIVRAFFDDVFEGAPTGRVCRVGKYISLVPDFPVPPHSVFCAGVKVGEIEKGRVVPHHQLFAAFGSMMKRKIDLSPDDVRVRKYIGGETISCDISNGWCAVLCSGCALGGGKAVDGVVKNHYPKGLRRKI